MNELSAASVEQAAGLEDTPTGHGSTEHGPVPSWLQVAVDAAAELKALDLRLLDLRGRCDFADYFLICSGRSDRQVQAIADRVERRLREVGQRSLHTEGARQGQWVLIDYADLVVHVFDPTTRDFYRLDRLWNDAPVVTSWDGEQEGPGATAASP